MWQNSFKSEIQKLASQTHGNPHLITEESSSPLFHDQNTGVTYDPNRDLKNKLVTKQPPPLSHVQSPPPKKPKTLGELFTNNQ